jgi:trans-aconitate methyltransferase
MAGISLSCSINYGMEPQDQSASAWNGKQYEENSEPQYRNAMSHVNRLDLSKYQAVLDLCCGTGKVAASIAEKAPWAEITGIDANLDMIKTARQKYGHLPKITFEVGDAQQLTDSQKFDLACSFASIQWAQDKAAVFRGVKQALKPAGLFLATCSAQDPKHPLLIPFSILKNSPPWSPLFANFDPQSQVALADKDELGQLLLQAKFNNIKVTEETDISSFNNPDDLGNWILGWLGGFKSMSSLPPKTKQDLSKALAEQYALVAPARNNGKIEYPTRYLLIRANS